MMELHNLCTGTAIIGQSIFASQVIAYLKDSSKNIGVAYNEEKTKTLNGMYIIEKNGKSKSVGEKQSTTFNLKSTKKR